VRASEERRLFIGAIAHDLPHLFSPPYRSEPSRNRQTGGAGLGLTIARRILRAWQRSRSSQRRGRGRDIHRDAAACPAHLAGTGPSGGRRLLRSTRLIA
jgi:hypothetical protein